MSLLQISTGFGGGRRRRCQRGHPPLRAQINLKHLLVQSADLFDWDRLSRRMSVSFVSQRGRPANSPHWMATLLYLQHAFALSDKESSGNGWKTRIGNCLPARHTCRQSLRSVCRV
ncbi:Transposase [Mycetohabitans rhizoxinica HKI 454]|uniref:Transposase n=1 Tax=Mycetohabitans rhizoxinica (strain DSM 19002 / CIP 109453 / HKI 454) TaxID=882378 RepID=E5ASF6_MYCRK|nr:Transposase [Mycetohabitans rhizoxinica HKI 454]